MERKHNIFKNDFLENFTCHASRHNPKEQRRHEEVPKDEAGSWDEGANGRNRFQMLGAITGVSSWGG